MKFLGSDIERTSDAASAFAGGASVDPLDLTASAPAAPAADTVRLFRWPLAGRQMPAFRGASGRSAALQPHVGRASVGIWMPAGSTNGAPGVFGYGALTNTGSATTRTVTTTSVMTRLRRIGYVSAGTAGSLCGNRAANVQITLGTTIGGMAVGGFFKVIRFGISDASLVSGARMFAGISSDTGAPANVDPGTLTNAIGMGHDAGQTTFRICYGGSAAQTPIDLGANFPVETDTAYELVLHCPPGSEAVHYTVTNLKTGNTVSGSLSGTSGVALPSPTTLLAMQRLWRSNNTTATAVGVDMISDYVESD